MTVKEFLKETYVEVDGFVVTRPHIKCRDGFVVSVQASEFVYCIPRKNLASSEYEAVELGFPNCKDNLIMGYAENPKNPTGTVYPFVPVEIVEKLVEKHGGIIGVIR